MFSAQYDSRKALIYIIAVSTAFLWLKDPLHAEEGGSGDYIPGLYSSVINITPNQPGLALGSAFLFYTGSAGGSTTLPFGGLLAANINADVYLTDVSLAYTFKPTFLGAHYTAAVAVPYVCMYGWMSKQR